MSFKYVIGLMSGTSIDGIDTTIVKTDGINLHRTKFNFTFPYKKSTRKKLLEVTEQINLNKNFIFNENELSKHVTRDHADAVNKIINISNIRADLIGFHGQTIYHLPLKRVTLQIGNGEELSVLTNTKVVSNFRDNDMNCGGQGAPISPIYHKFLIESMSIDQPCCIINIGGVSNLTYLYEEQLIGFDTGPGNGLMDYCCQKFLGIKYDKNGNIASSGNEITSIVNNFLNQPFFKTKYPKSIDKFQFLNFLRGQKLFKNKIEDILATLASITSKSIIEGLKILPYYPKKIIIMGGGQNNNYLFNNIKFLANSDVISADQINLPGDYIEAELMAYLAARTLRNLPITFPLTTGVNKPCVGGIINFN